MYRRGWADLIVAIAGLFLVGMAIFTLVRGHLAGMYYLVFGAAGMVHPVWRRRRSRNGRPFDEQAILRGPGGRPLR